MKRILGIVFVGLFLLSGCNTELKEDLEKQKSRVQQLKSERKSLQTQLAEANKQISSQMLELEDKNRSDQPTAEDKALRNGLKQSFAKEVAQGQVSIEGERRNTLMHLDDAILFGSGSAAPRPKGIQMLEKLAKELKKYKGYALLVEGHTDAMPISKRLRLRFATNQELAAARALAVSYYLEHELRVRMPMVALAYGDYQGVASNNTKKGRAKNRRVRLTLIPEGQQLF